MTLLDSQVRHGLGGFPFLPEIGRCGHTAIKCKALQPLFCMYCYCLANRSDVFWGYLLVTSHGHRISQVYRDQGFLAAPLPFQSSNLGWGYVQTTSDFGIDKDCFFPHIFVWGSWFLVVHSRLPLLPPASPSFPHSSSLSHTQLTHTEVIHT